MMLPRKVNHFRGNSPYLDQNTLWFIGYFAHSNRVLDTNLDYHAQNTPTPWGGNGVLLRGYQRYYALIYQTDILPTPIL